MDIHPAKTLMIVLLDYFCWWWRMMEKDYPLMMEAKTTFYCLIMIKNRMMMVLWLRSPVMMTMPLPSLLWTPPLLGLPEELRLVRFPLASYYLLLLLRMLLLLPLLFSSTLPAKTTMIVLLD
jgi:hypothetical protein